MAFSKARLQRSFLHSDERVEVAMAAGSLGVLSVSWLVAVIPMRVQRPLLRLSRAASCLC